MTAQALTLKFNTDLAGAQQEIAKFAAQTAGSLAKLSGGATNARHALNLVKAAAIALRLGGVPVLGAFVAVKAISAALDAATEKLAAMNKIGADAASAGVGATFFQGWTQQAKELNLETTDLVAMLEKAREAAAERIGEDGEASASAIRDRILQNVRAGNLGEAALSRFAAADTQEARIRVVLDLLDEMQRKGERLAAFDLAGKFFGAGFETQLRNGVNIIGDMRRALDGIPAAGGARIFSPEEIARAQQIKAEIDEIDNRLAIAMTPVMEQVVKLEQQMAEGWASAKLAVIGNIGAVTTLLNAVQSVVDTLRIARAAVKDALGLPVELPFPRPQGHPAVDPTGGATLDRNDPAFRALLLAAADKSKPLSSLTAKAAKEPRLKEQLDQVENYIESLRKLAAVEKAEADTQGLGNKAKQEALALAKALEAARERGAPLTGQEKDEVEALAGAYAAAQDQIAAFEKSKQDLEGLRDSALAFTNRFADGLVQVAIHGGKVQDVLRGLLGMLASEALRGLLSPLIRAAFDGGGGGILSLLPKFAEGGDLPSGRFGVVGERGPELIQGPAEITPFRAIGAALNSGGGGRRGGGNNARTFNIDARGAQAGVADQIAAALRQYDARLSRNLPTKLALADRRFG